MGKKKRKKCCICLKREHGTDDCPYMSEECCMGDDCKKFCMVALCTKFHKIIIKFHKASTCEKMKRYKKKLEEFGEVPEDAFEYHEGHKGNRCKSCSSKKRVRMLEKACEKLREKYEDEFESSDDDDDYFSYQMGMPMIGVKGVQMGVSQESQQNPIDTPSPTLELAHGEVKNYPSKEVI